MLALAVSLAAAAALPPQDAPAPRVLVRADQTFTSAGLPFQLTRVDEVHSNAAGGWCTSATGQVGSGFERVVLGSFGSAAPSILANPSFQTAFGEIDGPPMMTANEFVYRAVGRIGNECGDLSIDEVVRGTSSVVCLDTPGPVAGSTLREIRSFATDRAGDITVYARYVVPVGSGSVTKFGILRGDSLTPVLLPGDVVAGFSEPIVDILRVTFAERGARYGCVIRTGNSANGFQQTAVVDGVALTVQGQLLQRGAPVDPSAGGPTWDSIDQVVPDADGSWWVCGRDSTGAATRSFVMRSGEVVYRRGDIVDGARLRGDCSGLIPCADGSVAVAWRSTPDETGQLQPSGDGSLFREGRRIFFGGQRIDINDDGTADDYAIVFGDSFLFSFDVDIDEDGHLFVATLIDNVGGPVRHALLEIEAGMGRSLCDGQPNSTGVSGAVAAYGTQRLADNDVTLIASGIPAGSLGYFITGRTSGFTPMAGGSQGDLCLSGSIGRYTAFASAADADGRITLDVDVTQLPKPNVTTSGMPGETWHFQCWHRDVDGSGNPTSNFTEARSLTWR